jgi:Zn-dependent peptidase ImmA (M78 family)
MTTNELRAKKLAENFRDQHGLGDGPIKDMFELGHLAAGVDVISMHAAEAEHGLSMADPATGRAVVAVATTPHPMRQRSSIAHELGHVLGGDLEQPGSLTPGERSPDEIRADAFARHLLLPLDGVRRRFPQPKGEFSLADLSDIVQEFEVSPHLAAIQLRTLNLIDQATCTNWSTLSATYLATSFGWLSQYRSLAADSAQPRAPQGLMTKAVEGYRRGVLGIIELATWYGQDPAELEQELGPQHLPDPEQDDDWDSDAPLFPDDEAGPAS